MHPTIVQCMGVYIAHNNDCTTLKSLIGLKKAKMEHLMPNVVHSATAASGHIKYNGDHAVVTVGVIGRQTPILTAFCDYFGLDSTKAKEVHAGSNDYITYQIRQSTKGGNGTKLTQRRHANTATGAEVFVIWQAETNAHTFELTGEFDFQIKTANRDYNMEPLIALCRNDQWWNKMVDEMTKQKQALIDELRSLNKVKNPMKSPNFVAWKPNVTTDDVKTPSVQKKIKKRCKKKKTKTCWNPNAFTDLDLD